jgi:cytochrome c oxidase subunit II
MPLRRILMVATIIAALGGVVLSAPPPNEPVIAVTAKKWEFVPSRIVLHRGIPVIIELRSLDHKHGFAVPDLGIRVDVTADKATRVRVVPTKLGTFPAHCDVFCGEGHEDMTAEVVVVP